MSAAENRTPPKRERTTGSSQTASTAANPTPNRPTVPGAGSPTRSFDEARSGRQRLHALGVQGGTGVRRDEDGLWPVGPALVRLEQAQREQQPAWRSRPGGRVSGVLGELDDEPVAVPAEGEVLLGVGVLPEPHGRGGPRGKHPIAHSTGAERVLGHDCADP